MNQADLLRLRLVNQHLLTPTLREPDAVIAHLGAVQSQDYPAAIWAVAQRLVGTSLQALELAFERGEIVRTHVLRPTWHFVAPRDIRWLLALTAPRIKQSIASRERELGLDEQLAQRSSSAIARALAGGHALTRKELGDELTRAGIDVHDPGLLAHLISRAELDAVVCSGPRLGTQMTWSLLEERVPAAAALSREHALAEVVDRYFSSHGPATLRDFAWWSGLTVADARRGLEMHAGRFVSEVVNGAAYWFGPPSESAALTQQSALLLPNYDEYTVAYRDRQIFYPYESRWRPGPRDDAPFGNVLVLDGVVVGLWKRDVRARDRLAVRLSWFDDPTRRQAEAIAEAAERYARFLDLPLELSTSVD